MPKKNSGKEFTEIWGEAIHAARHLRILTIALGLLCLMLILTVFRLSGAEPPRPIVVRVDEVGRAEALAYDVAQAQADPLTPPPNISSIGFSTTSTAARRRLSNSTGPGAFIS